MSQQIAPSQNGKNLITIGSNLREIRKRKGLTLSELSQLCGFSVPFLSQIENAKVNINLSTLTAICNALEVSIVSLFEEEKNFNIRLIKKESRRWMPLAGDSVESILLNTRSNIELCIIHIPSGENTGSANKHPGEEVCYVKKGVVHVILSEDTEYMLGEGDVLYYDSTIPHRWENRSQGITEIIIINSPATY